MLLARKGEQFGKLKEAARKKIDEEKEKRRKAVTKAWEEEKRQQEEEERRQREKEEEERRIEEGVYKQCTLGMSNLTRCRTESRRRGRKSGRRGGETQSRGSETQNGGRGGRTSKIARSRTTCRSRKGAKTAAERGRSRTEPNTTSGRKGCRTREGCCYAAEAVWHNSGGVGHSKWRRNMEKNWSTTACSSSLST